jgi:ubiquitin-like 1-activating enzyme E1 A
MDHKVVSEADFCSQFLVPRETVGKNRAESSLQRAQALNPMVEIATVTSKLADTQDSFFTTFHVICVLEAKTSELVRIDKICRANNIKFFAADLWGMFGYSFADLQEHTFAEDVVKHKVISEPHEKVKTEMVTSTVKRTLSFPALEDVLKFNYTTPAYLKRVKKSSPGLVLCRALQEFRDTEGRDPDYKTRNEDLCKLQEIIGENKELAELIPDTLLVHLFAQLAPAAAIVGGEVAQEIIKTVSLKEAPHHNMFFFDPEKSLGFIESIEATQ